MYAWSRVKDADDEFRFPIVNGDGESEPMRGLIGALDCPVAHVDPADACDEGCCCPKVDCYCGPLPAINGQRPR